MKIRLYLVGLLGLALFISACKEDSGTDPQPPAGDTGNYYPVGLGTYYKFNLERTDSAGTTVEGQRSMTYTRNVTIDGKTYIEQTDSVFAGGEIVSTPTYFRKTESGSFFFLDTAGLSATVGDSFLQYINFDAELRYLAFPLQDGSNWPVFKMTLNYLISLNLVDVTASVVARENITLNLNSGTVTKEALKIKYLMTLKIPDPDNFINIITKTLDAHSWIVKDIGVVRWEGNAAVLGAFSGYGIDFSDSTTVVKQDLIEYNIR